jgi:signal transduction histidine kinase
VLAVLGMVEMAAMDLRRWQVGAALEILSALMLVWRRRYPLVLPTAASVTLLIMPWVGPQLDEPSVPILINTLAIYSLARWNVDLRGLLGVAVIGAAVFLDYALVDTRDHSLADVIFVTALVAPPFVLGRLIRRLQEQKSLLEKQQAIVREEAARAERHRIARELHDVIAHSVSAMVVLTAAARDVVQTDPSRAVDMLDDVADTGRRALAETGRLLHVMRDDADEIGLHPTPSLADLQELVDHFRASGLSVDLQVDGSLRPLPIGLDMSAYRIVQEMLTNALKYAADRSTSLRLSHGTSDLSILATNRSNGAGGDGSGLGLAGIAERVALFGGSLTHGNTGDGRFQVVATLPLSAGGDFG